MKIKIGRRKTKQVITVEDILAWDDVNDVLAHLNKAKPDITALIAIYEDDKEDMHWRITEGTQLSKVIYLLEVVRQELLTDE